MAKREFIHRIIIIGLLALGIMALRIWVFEPVTITKQMANRYLKENDIIIAVKGKELEYGDFVLYQVDGEEHVGRIIAKEGDSLTYMDDVLYRNNEIVEETYLSKSANHQDYYTEDVIVPRLEKKNYWILNDIRTNRKDSRTLGLISSKQVIGRLTFRISPIGEFGFIDNGLTQK
ncbi:signal peptidase I [Streptococcus acidominimus]|uniref:Signal peptidase I n=1 Tax=Streptococcus acidominimus TaxID=1326 RepID=A0A1Q8EA85_STRAI|nr:signal peptidase I [Streptococcus acidominimus]MBF0846421.1 signal peptidase I [Streptococcus danieliae]MBF0819266.1 signal peptidase I [Streptococcus acidominimus]MBF0838442.1 signal peptidase I [Streptococcus acidominimus]OLF48704.1 signal peptidase I [Streptococcus acidominimus]TFU30119.1 signal peptidase I [Streptococcus acidominimus]